MCRKNQTQASFREIRGDLVSVALCILEIRLHMQMEAILYTKTLRSDFHPDMYPLQFWPHQLRRQELSSYLHLS